MSFFERFNDDLQANLFSDIGTVPLTVIKRPDIEALALERAEIFEKSYKRNATTTELAQMYRMIAQIAEQKDKS